MIVRRGLWVQLFMALKGSTVPGKPDGGLFQKCPLNFCLSLIRGRWRSLFGPASVMLEHQFSYLARIRDRTCFRFLQTVASECFEKSAVNVDPEVSLQIIVCLRYIKHTGQHQLLHEFNQTPIPASASNDQMKVAIALNLSSIFFDAGLGRLSGFLNDLLKLGKIVFSQTSEAELHGRAG